MGSTLEEIDSLAPRAVRCPIRIPPRCEMARFRFYITREQAGSAPPRPEKRGGGPEQIPGQPQWPHTRAVETKIARFTLSTLAPAVLPCRLYPGLHRVTWWSIDLRPDADIALDRDRITRTDAGWLVVEQQ